MTRPVIISCALTGSGDTPRHSPHVPITPEQIATEALAAHEAGAAIVHIHVRDPQSGAPSRDIDLYREVVERIRSAGTDLIINLTTGIGARYVPDAQDPNRNASAGIAQPEDRINHVLELRPDICSVDIATMNFGRHAFVNVPDHIEKIATAVREAGVKPELEVFDLGHVALALDMYRKGLFADPPYFQLCLGVPWGAPATSESMMAMRNMLPAHANWSAFGISAQHFPMVGQSAVLGGHVRVGLEDSLYLAKGELAPGNAPMVARAGRIIKELGYEVATTQQARSILQIG